MSASQPVGLKAAIEDGHFSSADSIAAVFALSTLELPKAFGTKCAPFDETEGSDGDSEVCHWSLGFEIESAFSSLHCWGY